MEDYNKYLKQIEKVLLFKFFNDEEKKDFLQLAELKHFKKDDKIINEGEIQSYLFIVIKGTVNVLVKEPDKNEVFISAIGEGNVFGEAGIFLKVKRTANVISTEDTILLKIHRKNILTFIKNNKNAGIKLLMLIIYSLLRKLREANQELAFERKSDIDQDDIDAIIEDFIEKS